MLTATFTWAPAAAVVKPRFAEGILRPYLPTFQNANT
jgi:hypothetical protein